MPFEWEDQPISKEKLKKGLGPTPLPVELGGANRPAVGEQNISDYNWQDTIRDYLADPIRGFARMGGEFAGGVVGTASGIPGGTVGGALVGGTLVDQGWQNTLGRTFPRIFGGPAPNFFDSLKTSALESGMDLAFTKGVPALKGLAKTKAIQKFFPHDPNIPTLDAIQTAPKDLNLTIGQTTGNKFAQWIESVVVPEAVRDQRRFQQNAVKARLADDLALDIAGTTRKNIPTRQALGGSLSESASQQYKAIHGIRKDYYDTAKEEIADSLSSGYKIVPPKASKLINPLTGKPFPPGPATFVPIQIPGAVTPVKTIDFAKNTVLNDLDDVTGELLNDNYKMPEVQATIDAMRKKVQTFVKGDLVKEITNPDGTKGFAPVMTYTTAKADKDELNDLYQQLPVKYKKRLSETVKTLRNLIGQDIKDSSATWAPKAKEAFERANEYHKQTFQRLYGPKIAKMAAKIGKFTDDPDIIEENILQMGLRNATIAEEIVRASGTRKPLASEYLKKFFDTMTNANEEMEGIGGVEYLKKTKEVAAKFLNADQRAKLDNFARTVQAASWPEKSPPLTSIAFRAGYMGLSIGSGVLAGNISGSALTGGLGFAVIPWARGQLTEMMMNPANARLAARLARLPAGSAEGQSITKKLFRTGLKGLRFEIQDVTGRSLGLFTPQEDGRLRSVEQVDIPKTVDIGNTVKGNFAWE